MSRSLIFFFVVLLLGFLRLIGAEVKFTGFLWWGDYALYLALPALSIVWVCVRAYPVERKNGELTSKGGGDLCTATFASLLLSTAIGAIVGELFLKETSDVLFFGFFSQVDFGAFWLIFFGCVGLWRFLWERSEKLEEQETERKKKEAPSTV